MAIWNWAASVLAAVLFPAAALADDGGLFVGLDVYGGLAFGSSSTTDGGAPFAGGGIVDKVRFGGAIGGGGHVGYRPHGSPVSGSLSYQHVGGGVSWDATFPVFGVASHFRGKATSNLLMGNLSYDWALSGATSVRATAGAGLSFNTLSGVVETDVGTGLFLADVENHTRLAPAAQIGLGLQHKITSRAIWGLNTTVGYAGGFQTGDTRSGNLGVTPIRPYRIDHTWRVGLGTSIRLSF